MKVGGLQRDEVGGLQKGGKVGGLQKGSRGAPEGRKRGGVKSGC